MTFRFHNDVDTYVAHFTRHDIALDLILKNRSLRLGPLSVTNDPRETTSWSFAVGTSWSEDAAKGPDVKELARKNPDYNRLIRSGCRILCVSEDAKNTSKLDIHNRSYGKPRMWAQYGGNHAGVCLLFDKKILEKEITDRCGPTETLICGKVEYGDYFEVSNSISWMRYMDAFHLSGDQIIKDGLEATLLRHRDEFKDVFFFQKNKDWENENEFRWIIRGDSNEPIFVRIEDSLRAILLGAEFPDDRLGEVHQFCSEYRAYVARIFWLNGRPGVDWVPPNEIETNRYKEIAEFYRLLS
jgi:hypothetical protein